MKYAITLTLIAMITMTCAKAQEPTKSTNNEKKTKKELRKEERKKQFERNYQLLVTKSFVIEGDRVNGHEVYSNENFFKLSGDSTFLQLSPMEGITHNGFTGWIYAGKLVDFKLKRNEKNYSCTINLSFKNKLISRRDVVVTVSMDGNATVTSENIRMQGKIKDLQSANIVPRIPMYSVAVGLPHKISPLLVLSKDKCGCFTNKTN